MTTNALSHRTQFIFDKPCSYVNLTLLLKIMHCARNLRIIHLSANRLVNNLLVALFARIYYRLLASEKTDGDKAFFLFFIYTISFKCDTFTYVIDLYPAIYFPFVEKFSCSCMRIALLPATVGFKVFVEWITYCTLQFFSVTSRYLTARILCQIIFEIQSSDFDEALERSPALRRKPAILKYDIYSVVPCSLMSVLDLYFIARLFKRQNIWS